MLIIVAVIAVFVFSVSERVVGVEYIRKDWMAVKN